MAYGIFYAQCEITKKNGRLASIDDAIRTAEGEFFTDGIGELKSTYDTIEDAKAVLERMHCELCRAQFWSIGAGYAAYMYQITEIGSGDGYGFAEWTYPQDDAEG